MNFSIKFDEKSYGINFLKIINFFEIETGIKINGRNYAQLRISQ